MDYPSNNPNVVQMNDMTGWDICPVGNKPLYASAARLNGSGAVVYPDIYYKLQAHVLAACDRMDAFGAVLPSKELIESTSDGIYEDVIRLHPDIAEYARMYDKPAPGDAREAISYDYPQVGYDGTGSSSGPRGLLRDIIDILLLSEYYRRRRRAYYY